MTNLLSVSEAAEKLGLKSSTVYKKTSSKEIPFVKLGASVRFKEEELEEWINRQCVRPVTEK